MRKIARILTALLGMSSLPLASFAADALQIISAPADTSVEQGANIALTVQATGSPTPTFQWTLNGEMIPGATEPTLTLLNMQPADAGSYAVIVQNDFATLQSNPADIIVDVSTLPFADRIAKRGVIRGSSGVGRGDNRGAGMELLEPWTLANAKHSVWVSWTAPQSGIATFSTVGSGFDTLLGAFQVTALPLLPPVLLPVSVDDESGDYHTSQIQFKAEAGREYAIGIASSDMDGGSIVLSWNMSASASTPLILLPPLSQTVNYGEPVSFAVSVQSLLAPVFQWFKNDVPILGATSSRLNILNVGDADVGAYHCQVSVLGISVLSSDAELQINTEGLKAGARNKLSDALLSGIKGRSITALSKKVRALDISGSAGYSGTQVFQTYPGKDVGEPNHCGLAGGASYWLSYTPPGSGQFTLNTDGSSFDTILAVYVDNGSNQGYRSLIPVTCDNNSGADGRDSRVVFNVAANQTYYIVVDGVNAATGLVYLNYALNTAPVISAISSISAQEDGAAVTRSFVVGDRETAASGLQVSVYSSNPSLAYISVGGSDSSRSITVQPAPNQYGSTTVTVTVRDSGGLSSSTSFNLYVSGVNDSPVVGSDGGTCRRGSMAYFYIPSLLANDSDPDGDRISFYSFGSVSTLGGKVCRSGDYLYFTPSPSTSSNDFFTYTIVDSQGSYATGRVFVTVVQ